MTRHDLEIYLAQQLSPKADYRDLALAASPVESSQKIARLVKEQVAEAVRVLNVFPDNLSCLQIISALQAMLSRTALAPYVSIYQVHYIDFEATKIQRRFGVVIDSGVSEKGPPYVDVMVGHLPDSPINR